MLLRLCAYFKCWKLHVVVPFLACDTLRARVHSPRIPLYAVSPNASTHLNSRGSFNARLKLSTSESIALSYFPFLIFQVSLVKNDHIYYSSASANSPKSSTSSGDHLLSNIRGRSDKVHLLWSRPQAHFVQFLCIWPHNLLRTSFPNIS